MRRCAGASRCGFSTHYNASNSQGVPYRVPRDTRCTVHTTVAAPPHTCTPASRASHSLPGFACPLRCVGERVVGVRNTLSACVPPSHCHTIHHTHRRAHARHAVATKQCVEVVYAYYVVRGGVLHTSPLCVFFIHHTHTPSHTHTIAHHRTPSHTITHFRTPSHTITHHHTPSHTITHHHAYTITHHYTPSRIHHHTHTLSTSSPSSHNVLRRALTFPPRLTCDSHSSSCCSHSTQAGARHPPSRQLSQTGTRRIREETGGEEHGKRYTLSRPLSRPPVRFGVCCGVLASGIPLRGMSDGSEEDH